MPKVGFAYAPVAAHQRFVVRGGFGITYNRQNDNIFRQQPGKQPELLSITTCVAARIRPKLIALLMAADPVQSRQQQRANQLSGQSVPGDRSQSAHRHPQRNRRRHSSGYRSLWRVALYARCVHLSLFV